jgi:hypothetical protein
MRWFYVFLLALVAWGGFVQVVLRDDAHWNTLSATDAPVS